MATGRKRGSLDDLTLEQRAKVEAARAKWHSPKSREAEIRDRESLSEERRSTGRVETDADPIDPAELLPPSTAEDH